MGTITLNINNQQIMTISQEKHDGVIILHTGREDEEGTTWAISTGDLVMLMNYYRYKKEKGEEIFGWNDV